MDAFLDLESWCESALEGLQFSESSGPVSAKSLLRFALGASHKNGTKVRVDQATDRACALFEAAFSADEMVELVLFDFQSSAVDVVRSHFGADERRDDGESEQSGERLDLAALFPEGTVFDKRILGPSDYRSIEVEQRLTRLTRESIEHRSIFRAIANREMGFKPSMTEVPHFYGRASGQCFYMYDDRGCVIAGSPTTQDALAARFGDWVMHRVCP